MAWTLDARIPLTIVADRAALAAALAAGGPAAVLAENGAGADLPAAAVVMGFDPGAHVPGCACGTCGGRNAAALALDRLFQARVRGAVPWFTRVVALAPSAAGRAVIMEALAGDALTAARYRAAASGD
ncbi:MAG TPA: hypothetical protein VD970_01130 [Acetobacteraceae bacterium]|nr:hypothetical protein [Acetobacteraceae bacterium]